MDMDGSTISCLANLRRCVEEQEEEENSNSNSNNMEEGPRLQEEANDRSRSRDGMR